MKFFNINKISGLLLLGLIITFSWILLAIFAPFVAPSDPDMLNFEHILEAPSSEFLFGTDHLGRDIFSRVIFGARLDLYMGIVGLIAPLIIGVIIGVVAGYFGGVVDTLLMRLLDITIAFPFLILVLAIVAVLGPGLTSYFIALALVSWVPYSRLVRSQTLLLKQTDFVAATKTLGFSTPYILWRHILPNAVVPALVFAVTDFVLIILYGSSLGFLGMGVQPPSAEWGVMIADGQIYLESAWWMAFFPGMALLTLGLGASLLGDGIAKQLRIER